MWRGGCLQMSYSLEMISCDVSNWFWDFWVAQSLLFVCLNVMENIEPIKEFPTNRDLKEICIGVHYFHDENAKCSNLWTSYAPYCLPHSSRFRVVCFGALFWYHPCLSYPSRLFIFVPSFEGIRLLPVVILQFSKELWPFPSLSETFCLHCASSLALTTLLKMRQTMGYFSRLQHRFENLNITSCCLFISRKSFGKKTTYLLPNVHD